MKREQQRGWWFARKYDLMKAVAYISTHGRYPLFATVFSTPWFAIAVIRAAKERV